ncbi:RNA polymerase factor sigma-54 [Desulfovibrio ferrophilus]|uniref:RNA polymerase sigma 54 subunit RpoN n=1 Tax=Desulfovibrio ferrophilus TaxID=241368 RepID=A0A2Z6AWK8_9BACT|nr:RNA polymerase factor sigma-54 [Desulfovibrio ferrophilus]BBD07573.1 RNA polymerase sigma 54 subunit RpoN [Desulfovibrio ferrophilus]
MGLELRQQLKLSQQLVMTPQLQQAIKLLQLSRFELLDMVQQELLENPLLEEKPEEEAVERPAEEQAAPTKEETYNDESVEQDLAKTAEWESYLGEFSSTAKQAVGREYETPEEGMSFEARLSAKPSLESHLDWQLRLSGASELDVQIGEQIIGNLDGLGYLRATAEEIADQLEHMPVSVQATSAEVESVILRMQRFDPLGVAARDPRECLLVQLDAYNMDDPILVSLVSEHLEDLEKRRYKPIARKFKISMEELKEYLDVIQTLDPMPGSSFAGSEPQYVSPDVFVYEYDGEFVIVLNEEGLPRLQVSPYYVDSVKTTNSKDKEYMQDRMRSAVWLMKSLYQRQRTLYKVMESIVRFQEEFFRHGVKKLKPLILKDVADDIEMHESTISRITTSKYVSTPHGVHELKFFFNSALGLDDGSQVGSESVKAMIKGYIGSENPRKPLSDEKIAEMLKGELQVNIARRTVAKYRSALGILSSSKRKQIF